ncbi:OstA-like protein [Mucilaginibacter pallidiroseus]|uniref:OstA-like protein n=1 Tax=Mucilaginibacter pallidiroseus TaxID=2599295 RepID=UPI0016455A9A|nr:OstA-like protein [Mucilaginibacter pallidiroseus]
MIKYLFSFFLVLICFTAFGQKKSIIRVTKSKSIYYTQRNGKNVAIVYDGTFVHQNSVMQADSAFLNQVENVMDAYGNVHITQGDTLNIYSDKLNYNGNTKIATLTDNVRMIDRDAILTTNYLTYSTATKIGTYTGGGKLINKDNTLTSKNGYYFTSTRDAYFRYNVVMVTPEALIKTDTLRYNAASKLAYFLGPSNIYDAKDKKDTLYTENGTYDTATEQAFFGKNNLYKSGSKSLKGDSLFYDKIKGYGRAIKHVIFHDKEQNITLYGDLANYYKAQELTVVTRDPYVVIVTEEKDTTKTDSVASKPQLAKKSGSNAVKSADTKQEIADAPPAGTMPVKALQNIPANVSLADTSKINDAKKALKNMPTLPVKSVSGVPLKISAVDTAKLDSAKKVLKSMSPEQIKAAQKSATAAVNKAAPSVIKSMPGLPIPTGSSVKKLTSNLEPVKPIGKEKVKRDSIFLSADSLKTQIVTYKVLKEMQARARMPRTRDTSIKAKTTTKAPAKVNSKFLTLRHPGTGPDSSYLHRDFFGKPKPVTAASKPGDTTAAKGQKKAKRVEQEVEDPVFMFSKVNLADTARIRIVIAYHSAKLFKSDLQAKADSMFYSYADSTVTMFVQPILWTQGSQLSGDTVALQMKNKKLNNLYMYPSSFIVNIEKTDSTHFNQIAGKRMRGFFKDDKLDRMYVTGNAESIYFARDSGIVKEMVRSLSSRMRVSFKNNSASQAYFLTKPEHRYGPLNKFGPDEQILKGFIWKPKERPVSKESILPSYNRKYNQQTQKPTIVKKPGTTNGLPQKGGAQKPTTDTLKNKLPTQPLLKTSKDSLGNKSQPVKTQKDSLPVKSQPAIKPKADSTAAKKP